MPTLSMQPKDCKFYDRSICIPMYLPILFTVAKKWKLPTSPLKDKM